jgi:hypothetical protein
MAVWVSREKDQLAQSAGVKFSWSDIQKLVELAAIYMERFQEPAEVPIWMIKDVVVHNPRRREREARRAFVGAVEVIWRDCGASGPAFYYLVGEGVHDGPLLNLLDYLFIMMGESNAKGAFPGASTLQHDLQFLHHGREREHKRKVRQAGSL